MTMTTQKVPFQFGTLATRDNFIDRVEDRATLKQLLYSHVNTMLVSPRRWGKSSLVKVAMAELQEEHKEVHVCYIDAFSISSEAEFYRVFASQVIACASSKIDRWIADAKKFLTGVVPQIVVNDQVNNFMAFDLKYVPEEQDKLTILQLPETLAKDKGINIIVCIDEFQQLALLPEWKQMEGFMRSVWQQQEDVTYCLYGSKRHMMMDIFNNSNNPFYRFGQVFYLKKIAREYWVPYIVKTFTETGKSISEEFANNICNITECHSWYVQQLSFFIWSGTQTAVTEEIFQEQTILLVDTNAPVFEADVDGLSVSQVNMLIAIANGESHFSAQNVNQRYSLGAPQTISRNKQTLIRKDIIEKDGDSYTFVDPIFKFWFKKNHHA